MIMLSANGVITASNCVFRKVISNKYLYSLLNKKKSFRI
ncbi:Uncharacterised protein [Vibrio cholerae]|nr:Uncharacterised protein [Vibrio cholerae]CSC28567.1 Uncharacterised protein [Vibrio cholerae]CSD28516.1 Uncharacterised protein [Vibrio cholerae]CSI76808.1 Uncharacterised protein [Vibrio cholerae]